MIRLNNLRIKGLPDARNSLAHRNAWIIRGGKTLFLWYSIIKKILRLVTCICTVRLLVGLLKHSVCEVHAWYQSQLKTRPLNFLTGVLNGKCTIGNHWFLLNLRLRFDPSWKLLRGLKFISKSSYHVYNMYCGTYVFSLKVER